MIDSLFMLYSLRQLEIFLAVAKTQNISHAAESLCMSQSAASAAIKQLEKQFDVALFDRSSKAMVLTPAGRVIRENAQGLMDKALDFELSTLNQADQGYINIGASLTIGNYLGVKYFSQYLLDYPNTQATFNIANSPEIAKRVVDCEIDVGLIETEIKHKDIQLIPWRSDNLVVFCSPQNPLAHKQKLNKQDLLNVKWILREPGSATRQTFDASMKGVLHQLNVFLELGHNEAIKRAVEADIGIGCLSSIALEPNFKHGDLVPLMMPKTSFNRTFYFVVNKNRPISRAVEQWMSLCQLDS